MENNKLNVHPILTIMFKNVLRIFKAEIHKIFKNIQRQPKNWTLSRKEWNHVPRHATVEKIKRRH